MVNLLRIDNANLGLVSGWMGQEENYQWLDFGGGSHPLDPVALRVMTQRDSHLLRLFTAAGGEAPIGLVAFSNLNRAFKTALLWYGLGDKAYGGKGCTTRAVAQLLALGFRELRLEAVHAWAVEANRASIRVLERNHFRLIGRQRRCHYVNGRPCDRLLFDLLYSEYGGLPS